ncbi:MAG: PspC domain-containing protein [Saprospiraceae bacterium]|nr:PspC domain-containing protein [Saprospiraceae bacterium]
MNKTHTINVGGMPFTIDQDAYTYLHEYLEKIAQHFSHAEGSDEIIDDIEQRMAELLDERTKGKQIVSYNDVSKAIAILGTPAEFDDEDYQVDDQRSKSSGEYATGRKLFRDPSDKMVGGVCSGLAAYFGIQDPIWIRIAFALAAIGGGMGAAIYVLMWAIVPTASSPKDFLMMRGEPINVTNIARIVEEQVDHITDQLSELGNEWKEKKRKKKSRTKERKL